MAALKLYLQNSPNWWPWIPNPSIRGAWDYVGYQQQQSNFSAIDTAPGGSSGYGYAAHSAGPSSSLVYRFAYLLPEHGGDVYFHGAVTGVIGAREGGSLNNAHLKLHAFVLQGHTDTVRGTIWANYIDADEASMNAETAGEGFSGTISPLLALAGDALVLEVGLEINPDRDGTNYAYFGGTGSDLTNNGDITDHPGWIEFANTPSQSPIPVFTHHYRQQRG